LAGFWPGAAAGYLRNSALPPRSRSQIDRIARPVGEAGVDHGLVGGARACHIPLLLEQVRKIERRQVQQVFAVGLDHGLQCSARRKSGLQTIRPDGTGRTTITALPAASPNWSPDDNRIAYVASASGQPTEIHTVNKDGSNDVQLTSNTVSEGAPAWSPDGQKIAFHRSAPDQFRPGADIWTVNPDGTGELKLTADGGQQDHTNFAPDWQPIPNRPPDCSGVAASPDTLGPPNHKLVPVSLAGATDPDGDQVTLTITGVTQDEARTGSPDATLGPAANQVSLRAVRDGAGDGRVYRIAFTASDGKGGTCTGKATVGVPHDHGSVAVDSAPPSYDSLVH